MTGRPGVAPPRRHLTAEEIADLKRSIGAADRDERADGLLRRLLLDQVVNEALDTFDLDDLLGRLVRVATSVLDAERGTIFLRDPESEGLISRITEGGRIEVIRLPPAQGIAGSVFASGVPELVEDAYAHPRFYPGVDEISGYRTRSIACVPILSSVGDRLGVTELLNKRGGTFDHGDLRLLEAINAQAAAGIEQAELLHRLHRAHDADQALLEVAQDIASDLRLDEVLRKIVAAASRLVDAERGTIFLHDPKRGELSARVAEGAVTSELRIPQHSGIAGYVFATGEAAVVADAYADRRFEPAVDGRTGFRTRDLVCVPMIDRAGARIGVLQALNSRQGGFGPAERDRLQALAAQAAAAIGNARLLREVIDLRRHGEAVLRTLSAGIVTLDAGRHVVKVNEAARRMLRLAPDSFLSGPVDCCLGAGNGWLVDGIAFVAASGRSETLDDVELTLPDGDVLAVRATVSSLPGETGGVGGFVLSLEDLSREKRIRSTMARYIARDVLDKVLDEQPGPARETALATVLFSDIRQFTSLAEAQTAADTAAMLDEYFNAMVRIVEEHGGILDKFIGDAIMAVFGALRRSEEDAATAVRVAVGMIRALRTLNAGRVGRGLKPIDIGVGLATGEVVAGSVGAATRMDHTVIGDSVNLAARLEGATKHYGAAVLLDEATATRQPDDCLLRPIDLLRVKGKERPIAVFECLDHLPEDAQAKVRRLLPTYAAGLDRYRQRAWSEALDCFREVIAALPADGPSWVHADRCLYYRRNPPAESWDGVWRMHEK